MLINSLITVIVGCCSELKSMYVNKYILDYFKAFKFFLSLRL